MDHQSCQRNTIVDISQNIAALVHMEQFRCVDIDNNILVLSSYLPNDTEIYIQSMNIDHDLNEVALKAEKEDNKEEKHTHNKKKRNDNDDRVASLKIQYINNVHEEHDEEPLWFRVKGRTRLLKVFIAFANRFGGDRMNMNFFYDGNRLMEDQTVAHVIDATPNWNQTEPIQIDVMREQMWS
eukprot:467079_1